MAKTRGWDHSGTRVDRRPGCGAVAGDQDGLQAFRERRLSVIGKASTYSGLDDPHAQDQAQDLGCSGYFWKTDAGLDIVTTVRRVTSRPAANQIGH